MPYVNIKESGFAGAIGGIVGRLQGELSSKVSTTVLELETNFESGSPSSQKLQRITNKRNNLVKRTQSFEKRVGKFQKIPKRVRSVTKRLKKILRVLLALPIPTSVPPGIGIPLAVTNKYADILHKIKELIKQADSVAIGIEGVMEIEGGITELIGSLNGRLGVLDNLVAFAAIENEIKKLPIDDQKAKGFLNDDNEYISSTLMPLLLTGNNEDANNLLATLDTDFKLGLSADEVGFGKGNNYYHRGPNGDLYELAIIEDKDSPSFAKKRYAVAKAPSGVVVLKGQASFSADTDILLEEIKFRIDNQLP